MKILKNRFLVGGVLALLSGPFANAADNDPIFVPQGFVNISYWGANRGVMSLNSANNNFSAPVAASVDSGASDLANRRSRTSIEAQQSRIGFLVTPKSNVRGKFEFDFFNVSNSSPTTASNPRLRIAKVEWLLNDSATFFAGQDWDLFNGNVNPYTHNPVGSYFQGGNVAYMRQQMGLLVKSGSVEYGVALGLPQNSSTANAAPFASSNSDTDFARMPSLALRSTYIDGASKIGGAVIFANDISASSVAGLDGDNSHQAYGAVLFADTPVAGFSLRGKLYYGQNLKDIGTLGLSSLAAGTATTGALSTHDYGGFFTAYRDLNEVWAYYLGFGSARIQDWDRVTATAAGALVGNWQVHVGGDYKIPNTKSKMFLEMSRYASTYKMTTGTNNFSSVSGQFGIELLF